MKKEDLYQIILYYINKKPIAHSVYVYITCHMFKINQQFEEDLIHQLRHTKYKHYLVLFYDTHNNYRTDYLKGYMKVI